MEDIKSIIAKNISELRQSNKMTQLELAEKLNYSDKAVSKWERGESVPEIGTLAAISDLFDVSLDYLVRKKHPVIPQEDDNPTTQKGKIRNHSIITGMSILLVFFVALFIYVLIDIVSPDVKFHWLAFLYAVPVSLILWLIFNSIWFNKRRNFLIVSLLAWSILICFHISFLIFGTNIWQIYALGIPAQLIVIMWSKFKFKNKTKI